MKTFFKCNYKCGACSGTGRNPLTGGICDACQGTGELLG